MSFREGRDAHREPFEASYDIMLAKIVKAFPASAPFSGRIRLFGFYILLIFRKLEKVST